MKCDRCRADEAVVSHHRGSVNLFYCYECAIIVREDMRKQLVQVVKAIKAWERVKNLPELKKPDELKSLEPQTS